MEIPKTAGKQIQPLCLKQASKDLGYSELITSCLENTVLYFEVREGAVRRPLLVFT